MRLMKFRGVVALWHVPGVDAMNADPYTQQVHRVYNALKAGQPALVNQRGALLQHYTLPI